MSGLFFGGQYHRGVVLDGIVLRRANLRNCDLRYVSLKNADVRRADFTNSDIRDVDFRGAMTRGAVFKGVKLGHTKYDVTLKERIKRFFYSRLNRLKKWKTEFLKKRVDKKWMLQKIYDARNKIQDGQVEDAVEILEAVADRLERGKI